MKANDLINFREARRIHHALMTDKNETFNSHSKRLQRLADIAKENRIGIQQLSDICYRENNKLR